MPLTEGHVVKSVCTFNIVICWWLAPHRLRIERASTFTSDSCSEILLIYCPCFHMAIKVFVTCTDLGVGNCLTWLISFPRKWGQFPGHNIAISIKYLDRICHKTEIVRIDIFHLTSPRGIRIGGWSLLDLLVTGHWFSRRWHCLKLWSGYDIVIWSLFLCILSSVQAVVSTVTWHYVLS